MARAAHYLESRSPARTCRIVPRHTARSDSELQTAVGSAVRLLLQPRRLRARQDGRCGCGAAAGGDGGAGAGGAGGVTAAACDEDKQRAQRARRRHYTSSNMLDRPGRRRTSWRVL